MATAQTETKTTDAAAKPKLGRRKMKALGRKKRTAKLASDKEFAKGYFEAKSKRAIDKKSAYRKKKNRKK